MNNFRVNEIVYPKEVDEVNFLVELPIYNQTEDNCLFLFLVFKEKMLSPLLPNLYPLDHHLIY